MLVWSSSADSSYGAPFHLSTNDTSVKTMVIGCSEYCISVEKQFSCEYP